LTVDARNLPTLLAVGRNAILFTLSNGWCDDLCSWQLTVDGSGKRCRCEFNRSPDCAEAHVTLDLQEILNSWSGNSIPDVDWSGSTQTLQLTNDDGLRAAFRFRTPDDQLRFGTPLSEIALTCSDGMQTRVTSLILTNESALDFDAEDFDDIADRIGAKAPVDGTSPLSPTGPKAGADIRASLKLWSNVNPTKELLDSRPPLDPLNPLAGYGFRERLLKLATLWQEKYLKPLRAGEEVPAQKMLQTAVRHELDVVFYNAMLTLSDGGRVQLVDDPALVWRGVELVAGPVLARQLIDKVFLPTVTDPEIPLQVRAEIARHFARLGRPPWYIEVNRSDDANAFCTAIMKSCWQLNLTSQEVDACRRQLLCNDAGLREAAIETLVLADHVDMIPIEHLNAWADAHLRTADNNELSKWGRHCKINMLSMHSEGRAYLLGQLASKHNSSSLKREMVAVLVARVRAARKLKRFDFMTLAESNRIVEVMNDTMMGLSDQALD